MAFAGVLVSFGYASSNDLNLLGNVAWSELMATPGTTSQAAEDEFEAIRKQGSAVRCFEIAASADAFVSVGATPDAATGPRILVRAGETRNLLCKGGDRVAWAAA